MSKRFQRGLVVGKFSPLHRGHELVIRRALEECAEVVIISYSKPELPGCESSRREQWLTQLFPQTRRLVVIDERVREWRNKSKEFVEVPANDADETLHRRFCGFLCQRVLGVTVDAVFTSEDYGDRFAGELTRCFREPSPGLPPVQHMLVDRDRRNVPVSGRAIRKNIHAHREWLSPEVYASFVQRVCLLGGESCGKSTLTETLARKFGTVLVPEYGRELWERKAGNLTFENMRQIAQTQVRREEEAALRARQFVFCDTSPLTTLFYSHCLFGQAEPALEQLAHRHYDFTVLCAPDFPFVQDGTRQPHEFRLRQHEWYLSELKRRKIPFLTVTGDIESRVHQIRELLSPTR